MGANHAHPHDEPHRRPAHHHHPHGKHPHERGRLEDGRRHHHPVVVEPPPPEPVLQPGEPIEVVLPPGLERVTTYAELVAALADGARRLDLDGEFRVEGRYGCRVPADTELYIAARSDVYPADLEVGAAFYCVAKAEPVPGVLIAGYGGLAPIHGFRGFLDAEGRPTGRGIVAGTLSMIRNVEVYGCAENGVGGGSTHGTTLEHSRLHHNGSAETAGHAAAGLKWANMDGARVRYVLAEANVGNGLWVDVGARAFTVEHCAAIGNSRKGYHYEISYGPALYEDCLAAENGWAEAEARPHAKDGGFVAVSSQAITYRRCVASHNVRGHGILVYDDDRAPAVADVVIEATCELTDGDGIRGCELAGVTCE